MEEDNDDSKEFESWMKKKKATLIAFACFDLVCGMENSMVYPTTWLYLTTLIQSNNPKLFYSLITGFFYAFQISTGLLFGRLADKTGKVWLIFQCGNVLLMLGNIYYTIQFSALFPLVGRSLAGMGTGLRCVVYGELGRICNEKEFVRYVVINCITYSIGSALGPLINIFFTKLEFSIGQWHINNTNMPGFYMGLINILNQFLLYFMIHDLSQDLKNISTSDLLPSSCHSSCVHEGELSSDEDDNYDTDSLTQLKTDQQDEKTPKKNNVKSVPTQGFIWKQLLSSIDWVLMMCMSFFFGFTFMVCQNWLSLVITNEVRRGIGTINALVIEISTVTLLIVLLIAWKPLTQKMVFISFLLTSTITILDYGIFLTLHFFNTHDAFNVGLLVLFGFLFSFLQYSDELPCITVTAMAPKHSQGYVQGIHQGFFRTGAAIGLFSSPFLYAYMTVTVILTVVVSVTMLAALIICRTNLTKPQLIFE